MFAYDPSEHNPNFRQIAAEIYCGGQPSDEGFNLLKEKGIKTVINLREEPGQIARERELVESLGMTFLSVPMTPFQEPSEAAIKQFLELALKPESHPIFVHCLHGQDRTGAMVCIYRMEAHGHTFDMAYEEMVAGGFHKEFLNLRRAVLRFASRKGLVISKNESANL
jgi:protein tyrosine/serine phosphatase